MRCIYFVYEVLTNVPYILHVCRYVVNVCIECGWQKEENLQRVKQENKQSKIINVSIFGSRLFVYMGNVHSTVFQRSKQKIKFKINIQNIKSQQPTSSLFSTFVCICVCFGTHTTIFGKKTNFFHFFLLFIRFSLSIFCFLLYSFACVQFALV